MSQLNPSNQSCDYAIGEALELRHFRSDPVEVRAQWGVFPTRDDVKVQVKYGLTTRCPIELKNTDPVGLERLSDRPCKPLYSNDQPTQFLTVNVEEVS